MGKKLWVERNEKDGSWDAFSEDGAHIKFGKGKGLFTPGDLSKIALAACSALSSQFAIETALGEGQGASIVVDGITTSAMRMMTSPSMSASTPRQQDWTTRMRPSSLTESSDTLTRAARSNTRMSKPLQ